MERYKTYAQWAAAQNTNSSRADFDLISAVGALSIDHLGGVNYHHEVPGEKIGGLLLPSQAARQRMHRFLEGVVNSASYLSQTHRDNLQTLLFSDVSNPNDESMSDQVFSHLWQPAIDTLKDGKIVSIPNGDREDETDGLHGMSRIALEIAGIMEPDDPREGLSLAKKAKLYQPDLDPQNPWLEFTNPQQYDVRTPGIVQVALSRPESTLMVDVLVFPIPYARYGRFQSLAGLHPEEARQVLMGRVGRNGKGFSQEEVIDAIEDGRKTYRPAQLQVVLTDTKRGLIGNIKGEFSQKRHGNKLSQGFVMSDSSQSATGPMIVLKELDLRDADRFNEALPASQLAKDLIALRARPPRKPKSLIK